MKSAVTAVLGLALLASVGTAPAEARPGWCGRASLPTEKAICANSELWSLDAAINTAYGRALADSPGDAGRIREAQRAWLRLRNACGYDVSCIQNRYYQQIGYLEGFFYN